jgi:phospholipase C
MNRTAVQLSALFSLCSIFSGCGGGLQSSHDPGAPPSPSSQIPRSPIKHLIIVTMQNASFDHLFGTYPGGNGFDPSAASYTQTDSAGNKVHPVLLSDLSPPDLNHTQKSYTAAYDSGKMDKYAFVNGDLSMNYYDDSSVGPAQDGRRFGVDTLWLYAKQYALADNFFAAAMASEPSNMLYMTAAYAGSGSDPFGYPQLDACTEGLFQQNQANGATITPPLTFSNVGDQLSARKISWGFYQEFFINQQNGTCDHYVPQENPFQYFRTTANSANVLNFTLSGFTSQLASGNLPAVTWVQPSPAHSMHPGSGNIADGIEWLDDLVQAVRGSQLWSSTAILVVWDESGGWYDHVAPPQLSGTLGLGARVPVLLISQFAKQNYVSQQRMDFVSILRFIQWNWGLGKFTDSTQASREQQSGDICDLLTSVCGGP